MAGGHGTGRARSAGAVVLGVLGCLLAPVALVAVWLHTQVADTDRFVETMGPLADDPAVRAVLTDRVTDAVLADLDVRDLADRTVDALADRGLPPGLASALHGLAGPLESGVRDFAHARIAGVLAGDRFAATWDGVLRVAHRQAVTVLTGTGPARDVVLDLAPLAGAARQRLADAGLETTGRQPTITVAAGDVLARARTAYSLLEALAGWLPWVTLGLLAGGVALAHRHRRAVVASALGVAAGLVVLAAGLAVGRGVLAGSVAPDAHDAATAAFDLAVRFLRDGLRALLVAAVVVALVAFLTGPAPAAVRLRRAIGRPGPVGRWVHANRGPLRWLVVGAAAVVFVFLDRPGAVAVALLALAVALCLAVIRVLDRPPAR